MIPQEGADLLFLIPLVDVEALDGKLPPVRGFPFGIAVDPQGGFHPGSVPLVAGVLSVELLRGKPAVSFLLVSVSPYSEHDLVYLDVCPCRYRFNPFGNLRVAVSGGHFLAFELLSAVVEFFAQDTFSRKWRASSRRLSDRSLSASP